MSEKADENLEQERQSKGAAQALVKGDTYKNRDLGAMVFDVFGLTERDEMMPNESKRECRARAAMARSGDANVSNVSLAAKPANSKNESLQTSDLP